MSRLFSTFLAVAVVTAWSTPSRATGIPDLTPGVFLSGGAGGDAASGGAIAAFITLGSIASGIGIGLGFGLAAESSSSLFAWAPLVLTLPVIAMAQLALARLLGVPASWQSAAVGTLLGALTSGAGLLIAGGLLRAGAIGNGSLADIGFLLLAMILGGAIGIPVFTWLDPFDLAEAGGGGEASRFSPIGNIGRASARIGDGLPHVIGASLVRAAF